MKRRQAINSILFTCVGIFGSSIMKKDRSHVRSIRFTDIGVFKNHIIEVSELIIPRTNDSPGAKDAGVAEYIVRVLTFCSSEREKKIFMSGLLALEGLSLTKYSRSFINCLPHQKTAILDHFAKSSIPHPSLFNKIRRKLLGPTFFEIVKLKTIEGYCTSKIGSVHGLAYDYLPSNYSGCVQYSLGQKSWAQK